GLLFSLRNSKGISHVMCSPLTQLCKFLGKEYTLLVLNQLIPFVKTTICDEYLCYIYKSNDKDGDINPKGKDS
ncbi:hypothetical protein ACLBVW_37425, partial [Pseudomonas aeruginosa]|uniref:hypothetical protein n=1 Tax=Pseudomonas aeruginosa TaxID=287 RepID=UPI003969DCC9